MPVPRRRSSVMCRSSWGSGRSRSRPRRSETCRRTRPASLLSTSPTTAVSRTRRSRSSRRTAAPTRSRSRASTATTATSRGCCASSARRRFRSRAHAPTRRPRAAASRSRCRRSRRTPAPCTSSHRSGSETSTGSRRRTTSGTACRRSRRRTDAAGGAVIPVDANAAVLSALNARAADPCSPAKANDVVRAVGTLLDNPQIVTPSVKYIVVVGDDAAGIPFGRILDNTAYRERARLCEHVLRQHEQPVPEHVRARLPADRRPARRRQLLGRRALRSGAGGRPARRDADRDPRPDQPVRHAERRDHPGEGADDGLRLPERRRVADLGGLQGAAGPGQRAGADQRTPGRRSTS